MTPSLPSHPSIEYLKKQAKSVHKAHKAGDPSCCEVLRKLKRFAGATDADILAADAPLKEVQFALAMHYDFDSWGALKKHLLGRTDHRYLHLLCGDMSGRILRESTVPGEVSVWMEDFIKGPLPRNVSEDEWRRTRARHIMSYFSSPHFSMTSGNVKKGITVKLVRT